MFINYSCEEPFLDWKSEVEMDNKKVIADVSESILVVAPSGHGKNNLIYTIIESKHDEGHIIVSLSDPKRTIEMGFCFINPLDLKKNVFSEQQIANLRKNSKTPRGKDGIIWHPFSFNIKKEKNIPKWIKFFTFNIKEMDEEDFAILLGVSKDNSILPNLVNLAKDLKDDEGLIDFSKRFEELTKPKGIEYRGKFIPRASEPTFNTLQFHISKEDIQKVNTRFANLIKENFILAPANCPHNLKAKYIFEHQEFYHIFAYHYLYDLKDEYFVMYKVGKELVKHQRECDKKIDILINEIKNIVPNDSQAPDYIKRTAELYSSLLSMMRNSFESGGDIIADTQNHSQVEKSVADNFKQYLCGNLSIEDIGTIGKKISLDTETKKRNQALTVGEFMLLRHEEKPIFTVDFCSHSQKHEGYDFFKICNAKGWVKDYKDVIDWFEEYSESRKRILRELDKQRIENEKFKQDLKIKYQERNKDVDELIKLKEERKQEKEGKYKDRNEKIILLRNESDKYSLTDIAKLLKERFGFSNPTTGEPITKQTIANVLAENNTKIQIESEKIEKEKEDLLPS